MQEIVAKLDRLADMKAHADVIRLHFEQVRDQIIPPEIKQQLAELDAEYQTSVETLNGGISELEAEIKADVLACGASVKGAHLQAVWAKGRVSWDSKGLDGAIVLFPELAKFRKEGEPSVSLRRI